MSLQEVLSSIREAERAAGRAVGSVQLVAVTKGHPAAEVRDVILSHGSFPLGESRGQELRDKKRELAALHSTPVEWHFIGALQMNKLKYLEGVTLIHSLVRADHAAELVRLAQKWGRAPDVLLQMHNGEAQKQGAQPHELRSLYDEVTQMGINVRGLMVMAPEGDLKQAELVFRETAARAADLGLSELSMGMSDDYTVAINCGATLVRVGRKLFS